LLSVNQQHVPNNNSILLESVTLTES